MDRVAFLDHLAAIDFSERYYALCAGRPQLGVAGLDLAGAVAATDATWARKRGFHRTAQDAGGAVFALNLSEKRGKVEAVLDVATADGQPLGGPFPALAFDVGLRQDPDFDPVPPYPRVTCRSQEDLAAVVAALVQLYAEVWERAAGDLAAS